MSAKEQHEAYWQKLRDAGHVLKTGDAGEVDYFVYDVGNHNGPGCVKCGQSWCHHCEPEPEKCTATQTPTP